MQSEGFEHTKYCTRRDIENLNASDSRNLKLSKPVYTHDLTKNEHELTSSAKLPS
jgi:hypothetical protein